MAILKFELNTEDIFDSCTDEHGDLTVELLFEKLFHGIKIKELNEAEFKETIKQRLNNFKTIPLKSESINRLESTGMV